MAGMTLIWTTLPAGIRRIDGAWSARVSVYLTPRLEAAKENATLANFPAFIDWPKTLREAGGRMGFVLKAAAGGDVLNEIPLSLARQASAVNGPHSGTWRRIFSPSLTVRPFDAPDLDARSSAADQPAPQLMSYPARPIVNAVRQAYADTLAHELGLDNEPPAMQAFTAAGAQRQRATQDADNPLAKFMQFHRRATDRPPPRFGAGTEPAPPDFHQIVSALGTHPRLMRRTGIVIDFEIRPDDIGLDLPGRDLRIVVAPAGEAPAGAVHVAHWTAVEYDSARSDAYRVFTVAHENVPPQGGFRDLRARFTTVAQEKTEHAVFSLMQHAEVENHSPRPLPALVQGGMRVSHSTAVQTLAQSILSQRRLESRLRSRQADLKAGLTTAPADDRPLFADDVVRGYRIDVRNADAGRWRSLCARHIVYRSGDDWSWPEGRPLDDEGVIEPSTCVDDSDDNEDGKQEKTTEDLFEWDGWSLVVPRPEQTDDDAQVEDLPFEARLSVPPGSLPVQRFGQRYRFRARDVDLAGNSLSVAEADAIEGLLPGGDRATSPIPCLRVESAKPPDIFPAQPRGPGEAGDVIVLRDAESPRFRTTRLRFHIVPPDVPLRIIEKHGVFDRMDGAESWQLIRNHRGELARDEDGNEREFLPVNEMYTPYLPDPVVKRAVLKLPGGAGSVTMPSFVDLPRRLKDKEFARSCSLVVRAGGDALNARAAGRSVTLTVPRGTVTRAQLTAWIDGDDLREFAVAHEQWHTKVDHPLGAMATRERLTGIAGRLTGAIHRGDVPVLAPARTLTIIHATQRPLTDPAFGRPLILPRAPTSTTALLADDELDFHRASTGRIDLYASWRDPVDDPAQDGWRFDSKEIHAAGVRVPEVDGNPLDPASLSAAQRASLAHDFGDTKHHEVSYRSVGTSRFVEFYAGSLTEDVDNMTRSSAPVTLHVPATTPPAAPDVAYVLPTLRRAGDAKDADAPGTIRQAEQIGAGLRVYLNRGWFSSGAGEQLAVILATPRTAPALADSVSTWGVNPTRDSAPLPGPLRPQHVWGGAGRREGWPLQDSTVTLVLHDVQFGEEHGLPFADIDLLTQQSHLPLIRLALARYQEHAIETCQLSSVVLADFVPLSPGRAVTVTRTAHDTWRLTMRGHSYRHREDVTSVARARLEIAPHSSPDDPAAWQPLGVPVTLKPRSTGEYRFIWSTLIRIDDEAFLSWHWRRRIVIEEFEPFDHDGARDIQLEGRSRLLSAHVVPV